MENASAPSVVANDVSTKRRSLLPVWMAPVSFGVSHTRPATAENESCRLMLAMAYGFLSKISSSARPSAVGGSFSRLKSGASCVIESITQARRMLGDAPTITA